MSAWTSVPLQFNSDNAIIFISWPQLEVAVVKMHLPLDYEKMPPVIQSLCRTKQKLYGSVTAENKGELHYLGKINYVIVG